MIKLGVIYGGISTEKEVSEMSAKSVLENLNKEKYEIHEIFINQYGKWFEVKENKKEEIYNLIWYLKELDVVFPVLHGKYGEDGTIQGMLEMLQVPYVGCGVLASSVGMDKVYTKMIFEKAGIPQAPYIYIRKQNDVYKIINDNCEEEELKFKTITSKFTSTQKSIYTALVDDGANYNQIVSQFGYENVIGVLEVLGSYNLLDDSI